MDFRPSLDLEEVYGKNQQLSSCIPCPQVSMLISGSHLVIFQGHQWLHFQPQCGEMGIA